MLAARALGADLAYVGTRFIASKEAVAMDDYKQMLVESTASDIVYTNLFSGVHGNYLRGSVEKLGLDPANMPTADKTKMNFGSGGDATEKVWRDIWSAGQGPARFTMSPAPPRSSRECATSTPPPKTESPSFATSQLRTSRLHLDA